MDYELAMALKDAGFPQTGLRYTWYFSTNPMGLFNSGEEYLDVANHPDRTVCPTLEELIEACGGRFHKLIRVQKGWDAWEWIEPFSDDFARRVNGGTPTEAVARLWLALNKK